MNWLEIFYLICVIIICLHLLVGCFVIIDNCLEKKKEKPAGYRLKKYRNKVIKREHNNEIKKVIKDCRREYKDGHSYFSVVVYYKYFDLIKNTLKSWCEDNNIDYDWTDYDNGLGMTIRIDFK